MRPIEREFEDAVEASLLEHGGYVQSSPAHFDRALGLDTAELFAFIGATQVKAWNELVVRYGNDADEAQRGFARRLAKELDERGTIEVLRHGVVDVGVTLQLAFFKPAHGLTPELVERYEANRVSVTRQLAFDPASTKAIDIALLVNGIPVATAELKNPLTGQNVDHAVEQYRSDRDPANVTLSRRALVHFAVDPHVVKMTTKLEGATTRFLPFNQGSAGAGQPGGAGNPPNPHGHQTAYLWEQVWQRDAWLDLLARFVHVSRPTSGSKADKAKATNVVFPRFHQWDAVRRMESHAREQGAGQRYLVQHSAGSGKSNTIGWLAHRLSNLHDAGDAKVFDKVVIITDRVVLDRQLQDTVYQFEHAHGVVVKIDKDSSQLADALAGQQARIIITTLQKFPYVLDKIAGLPSRRYAVIIDEAHSSQSGDAARDLRIALGGDHEGRSEGDEEDTEDKLRRIVEGRGAQPNLSMFAFTATPKAKTLEMFGTLERDGDERRSVPFHLYSMRQAIEEKFILDVLAHYVTYDLYYRLEKAVRNDPTYDESKAKRAIARFLTLHPSNIAQKVQVIVEHYRQHVRPLIGGQAKAMIVTSSRLHAVRYKLAVDAYIAEQGYTDVAALVAFSGEVTDDDGEKYTETRMNRFPESETAERFNTASYQLLLVAEKFQTGFDQPLLAAMYVDKPLSGVNAVQTLSRLNRIHEAKDKALVLDFRNNAEDIQAAFAPYFERTSATPTDPNELHDSRRRLDEFPVLLKEEIIATVKALLASSGAKRSSDVYAALAPAVARFVALDDETQGHFRDALTRFVNVYSFLSQVVSYGDTDLERDYLYCRALQLGLPSMATDRLDLGSEVELTHLRLEKASEGAITLEADGDLRTLFGEGSRLFDPDEAPLSQIINVINERYGLNLGDADRLLLESYKAEMVADTELAAQAKANTLENFKLVFEKRFLNLIVKRMDGGEELFKKILDDGDFRQLLFGVYLDDVYRTLRQDP